MLTAVEQKRIDQIHVLIQQGARIPAYDAQWLLALVDRLSRAADLALEEFEVEPEEEKPLQADYHEEGAPVFTRDGHVFCSACRAQLG